MLKHAPKPTTSALQPPQLLEDLVLRLAPRSHGVTTASHTGGMVAPSDPGVREPPRSADSLLVNGNPNAT